MHKRFKLPTIFYLGMIPILYLSIKTVFYQAQGNSIVKYGVLNNTRVKKLIPDYEIGITRGILMFIILTILWIVLIKLFSSFKKNNEFINNFFVLGEISVNNLITKLFYLGIILIVYWAYIFRMYFSNVLWMIFNLNNTYYIHSVILVISYIVTFVIILTLWKIICELLIIILRCFEAYFHSKNT